MSLRNKLNKDLLTLTKLEVELKEQYDDPDLFKEINLHKKSLVFFLNQKDYKRSIYESNSLVCFLVSYLSE
jgi:hypothetical protein